MNKRRFISLIQLLLLVVLLYSLYRIGSYYVDLRKQNAHADEMSEVVDTMREESPQDEEDEFDEIAYAKDFVARLRENVEDAIGFVEIPETQLRYVVVQGEDNEFYLDHDINKEKSVVGAVFLDVKNSADGSDWHNILYGHNMRTGTYFGMLRNYRKDSFLNAHPEIVFTTESGVATYRIFAVFEANEAVAYRTIYTSEEEFDELMDIVSRENPIYFDRPEFGRVLTLSTCTTPGRRLVIMGIE